MSKKVQFQGSESGSRTMLTCPNHFEEFKSAGVCSIPILRNGSKRTSLQSWAEFQTRFPTDLEVNQWHARRYGIAIVCGVISGGLEVLDFDENADANFEIFRRDAKSIVCRLPVVESAGGGYHVYYRCNLISGNHKIAQSIDRKQTYVETRGQGGYIIAPGCPAACHPSGNLYLQVMGPPLPQIPTISVADRRSLWEVARQFDERPWHQDLIVQKAKEIKRAMRPAVGSSTNAPWVLMKQSDWRDILEPHGWRSIDGKHWIRPGKKEGTSAIVTPCTDGNNVLVVFSANAGPLSPSTKGHSTWDQFSAFAALNHAGDRKAAAITARRLLNG